MAVIRTVKLRRFQVLDALHTAPIGMPWIRLLMRMAGTFHDSLYARERYDLVVAGDDPVVSLCVAYCSARAGNRVLLAPDSLSVEDWPSESWSRYVAGVCAQFGSEGGDAIASLTGVEFSSLRSAITGLVELCAQTGRVEVLQEDLLQTSLGHIRESRGRTLFCLSPGRHNPTLNPLWRLVRSGLVNLRFNRQEVEFIHANRLVFTTPASRYMDPALGDLVGQARSAPNPQLGESSRAEDIISIMTTLVGRD